MVIVAVARRLIAATTPLPPHTPPPSVPHTPHLGELVEADRARVAAVVDADDVRDGGERKVEAAQRERALQLDGAEPSDLLTVDRVKPLPL